jgi:hypothetical protein
VFLLPAAILSRNAWRLLAAGQTAPGVVVGVEPGNDGEGSFPVVSFTTPDGQAHRFRDGLSSSFSPAVGGPVEVLYDPAAPSRARVKSFWSLWLAPLFFGGFGLAIVGAGLAVFLGVGEGGASSR